MYLCDQAVCGVEGAIVLFALEGLVNLLGAQQKGEVKAQACTTEM